jgi:hypothetical protein
VTDIRRAPAGVDVVALAAEVERRAAARPPLPEPGPSRRPFPGVERDPIARARAIADGPGVEYRIGWRTPILGQAWAELRKMIHGEARLYVDALMARQSELDAAFLEEVAALREEIGRLADRVAALERCG